ncbi:hypothetical protein AS594_07020 [Streptomyces agglomeratus]|uniref:Uncharacterized protein n=1 Tax=Streptomyces agglomeratus TaxID=285458 RepID=A0A1E5P407_9ACTN|nr:hypothetical protein [Streptomyces agglomeratus]OEJ24273.1 hypothetical protein AS594_07020 [Streptomyces agglomeratus]
METRITVRTWYGTGQMYEMQISPAMYAADMLVNRDKGEASYRWTGEDRNGERLHVTWVPAPRFGTATLYAYEVPLGSE